jgi:hypothetical protein
MMDSVITRGGLLAIADPRGTGKTQRAIRGAIKAILTGKRKYVVIIAATEKKARAIIKSIRTILCYSQILADLFPAEVHGFRQLGGNNRKAGGQLCNGKQTEISIGADSIAFGEIPGSVACGAIIASCGITGDVRGQFHTLQSGRVIRPDLLLADDPQTKESARSVEQTNERLEIIEGDCLGLAGPDTSIACLVLCTVIEKGDLSEQILGATKWHGVRTKTIYDFPTDMKAWDEYFADMEEFIRLETPEKINETYLERREILDAGCVLAWEHRKEDGDLTSIQTAMHILHRVGSNAFGAEFQNDPVVDADESTKPTFKGIELKTIGLARGVVPNWANILTLTIDVQMTCLFWMLVAWKKIDFTGHIVNYGAWPEQERTYYTLKEVTPTLQDLSQTTQPQGALRWGLDSITKDMLER